jgi:antitoxin (DNA-binding transcriptional repressor) of toxin-antitoxin stability system
VQDRCSVSDVNQVTDGHGSRYRGLRGNLSRYFERVQRGEDSMMINHGSAVARVPRIGYERALDRLIEEGVVTPANAKKRKRRPPLKAAGKVSDLVAEQRR